MKIHLMFYISLLQPLKREPLTHEVPPPLFIIVDNGDGSYFIDLIDDMRWKTRFKRLELLIKWEGYETRIWETYNQIKADAPSLIKKFYKDHPL